MVSGAVKSPADCADMTDIRAGIDAVDRELIALFAARSAYIARAAEIKKAAGIPANVPSRVADVLAKIRAAATKAGLDPDLYAAMWQKLIDASIAAEERHLSGSDHP